MKTRPIFLGTLWHKKGEIVEDRYGFREIYREATPEPICPINPQHKLDGRGPGGGLHCVECDHVYSDDPMGPFRA